MTRARARAASPDDARSTVRPRDLQLAAARLGRTAAEHLRWVLAFAERDLEQLSSGEWVALGDEVVAFVAAGHGAMVDASLLSPAFDRPTEQQLRQLHARLTTLVAALLAHHAGEVLARTAAAAQAGTPMDLGAPLDLPPVPTRLAVAPPTPDDPDAVVVELVRGFALVDIIRLGVEALAATFEARVADVLPASRPGPRRCRECGRLFAPRGRQLRHPTCAQKRRDRTRQAKRKADERELRRAREARQQERSRRWKAAVARSVRAPTAR